MKHQESTSIDPQDRFGEGWEPAPIPPITADGRGPAPPKYAAIPPEPPSLCRQGPCVNYFEIKHPLNAALPTDGTPGAIFRKTLRACFPGGGVEVELEDTPVFECSRWDPDQTRLVSLRITRSEYLKSEEGIAYTRELEEWEAARKAEAAELDAAMESDTPPAPPSVLVEMQAELAHGGPFDRLMLYQAGKFVRDIDAGDSEVSLVDTFGEGHFQLRLVRYKNAADHEGGVVASIRTIDLSKESV